MLTCAVTMRQPSGMRTQVWLCRPILCACRMNMVEVLDRPGALLDGEVQPDGCACGVHIGREVAFRHGAGVKASMR
jgi:hypothetical protein